MVVAHVLHHAVALGDHGDNLAAARLDFLDVADDFLVHAALGGDDDHGHLLVDEGDGTVLHLGGGVAFGVDVGDFLEFEGTFEGHGVVVAAAEVDEVLAVGEHLGELVDVLVVLEGPLHLVGNLLELVDEHVEHLVAEGLFLLGDGEAEEAEGDDLAGEGLGGGDADFGAHVEVGAAVGGAGDGGADDVADAVDEGAVVLGQLDGGEGVGGLTRLGDGDDHVVGVDDGVAVAEFGGVLDLDGQLAGLFDEVFADEGRVPRGAAGADDDAAAVEELLLVVDDAGEEHVFVNHVESATDAGAQGVGLLPDFLEHEVGEAALLEFVEVHLEGDELRGLLDVAEVGDVEPAGAVHEGNLLVVEVDDLVGVLDDGGGVGAEVELGAAVVALAHADDEGAALAGADQTVGVALLDDGDGIGADDVLEGQLGGGEEVAVVRVLHVFHQLDEDLGVGVGAEGDAVRLHHSAQRLVVLDDAVVHEGEVLRLRVVRVCVGGVGLAVGGPAGVGDAQGAADVAPFDAGLEGRHFAFGFIDREVAVLGDEGDACAVVATVFKTMEAFYQDGVGLLFPDVSYYSTHGF